MEKYFIDSTLIDHQLIVLRKLSMNQIPPELERNQKVRVKLYIDNKHTYDFENCHIDDTNNRRLRVPTEIMVWLRSTFAFSVAYYASHNGERKVGIWKKRDIKIFEKAIKKEKNKTTGKPIKMDIPGETILISWEKDEKGYHLVIKEGFRITAENAMDFLSKKAISSILPYILTTAKNISRADTRVSGKKCYIIDKTTNWLSSENYSKISFSYPGIYLLRRKTDTNEFAYYIGKSVDIKNRIIQSGNAVFHPNEKNEDNKQYDEIACIAVKFDDYIRLYGEINDNNKTPENNQGVKKGSDIDNALYAIEDIAIHIAAMLLLSEGKKLDNKQYRRYTSGWIKEL